MPHVGRRFPVSFATRMIQGDQTSLGLMSSTQLAWNMEWQGLAFLPLPIHGILDLQPYSFGVNYVEWKQTVGSFLGEPIDFRVQCGIYALTGNSKAAWYARVDYGGIITAGFQTVMPTVGGFTGYGGLCTRFFLYPLSTIIAPLMSGGFNWTNRFWVDTPKPPIRGWQW